MRIPNRYLFIVLTAVAGATLADTASAQTARKGNEGGGASAQLLQQVQQLASERTALQAESARMKKELAEITKERDTLKATLKTGRDALDQRARAGEAAVARSAQEQARAESELEKQKERMQELVEKFRETATTLRDVETERATFRQSLETRNIELAQCGKKNDALYGLNQEVLARMEHQGVWTALVSAEPFTKLKRTQLDNLMDDYRFRADDQKVSVAVPQEPAAR